MKRLLPLALLLCAASCRTANLPGLPAHQEQAAPLHVEGSTPPVKPTKEAAPFALTPPVLPVKPTRREYKAYKRQLSAWEQSQKAYAKASAGPSKVKAKGTGATATAATAAPGGTVEVAVAPVVTDNTKADHPTTGEGNAPVDNSQETTGLPWWPFAVGGVVVVGYMFRKSLFPFLS